MKVVPDTNIWVSYCAWENSFRARLIEAAHAQGVRFYVSTYILNELEKVLLEYLELSRRFVNDSCDEVLRIANLVRLPARKRGYVPGDPNDDPIVHTALAAKAHYLLTADRVLLKIEQVESIRIINESQFADILAAQGFDV